MGIDSADIVKFYPVAAIGVMAKFGDTIDIKTNYLIRQVMNSISNMNIEGITEITPSYVDLVVNFNPLVISYNQICEIIKDKVRLCKKSKHAQTINIIEILTCYEDEFALDKQNVISHTKLSWDDIVKIHTSNDYFVYMMGFMPGFCYLGGMDEILSTPRLMTPRQNIPAGSVGIAGSQTGIYPAQSPGGWQIIGQTPLKMYDENKNQPSIVQAGDYIRYKSISKDEFEDIKILVNEGKYEVIISEEYREWD